MYVNGALTSKSSIVKPKTPNAQDVNDENQHQFIEYVCVHELRLEAILLGLARREV